METLKLIRLTHRKVSSDLDGKGINFIKTLFYSERPDQSLEVLDNNRISHGA